MPGPEKSDVQSIMEIFGCDEEKATKMIACGFNVDFMRSGVEKTLNDEVHLDSKAETLKDALAKATAKFDKGAENI